MGSLCDYLLSPNLKFPMSSMNLIIETYNWNYIFENDNKCSTNKLLIVCLPNILQIR